MIHGIVVFLNQSCITILLIEFPYNQDHGTLISLSAESTACRSNTRQSSVLCLHIFHCLQISQIEILYVALIGCSTTENMCISHPAHTLISLRTVGRNADKITVLTEFNILCKPVDQFIITMELTGDLIHAGKKNCLHILQSRCFINSTDLNVTESMECEARFVNFYTFAFTVISIFIGSLTQVRLQHLTNQTFIFRQIRIEYFSVADCDLLSGFSFEFQNRYARNLLFQIINVSAW